MEVEAARIFRRLLWPCEGDDDGETAVPAWILASSVGGGLTGGKVMFQMCTSLVFPAVASMSPSLVRVEVGRRETE